MKRRTLAIAAALSVLVHLLLLAAFGLADHSAVRAPAPAPEGSVTAEMVFADPGKAPPAAPPAPENPQAPTQPPAPDRPPAAAAAAAEAEPAPPAQPATEAQRPAETQSPAQAAPEAASPPPAVRLFDGDAGGSTDDVRGEDVAIGPDPSAPNVAPRYPRDAVQRGQQGMVVLRVQIAANGVAEAVSVYSSSGFAALDRSAHDAVARWRFKPKTVDGVAMEAQTLVRIRFRLE